jgi:hypothetical protein
MTSSSKYIKKQELKKWEQGAIKASKNKDYLSQCQELSNSGTVLKAFNQRYEIKDR